MIRTQIQLEEKQHRVLREMAAEYNVSMATLIRQSVDRFIETEAKPSREELRQRAMDMAGKYHDIEGKTDVSINHDKYLAEIYAYVKGADDDID